jgi:hypothetical protein
MYGVGYCLRHVRHRTYCLYYEDSAYENIMVRTMCSYLFQYVQLIMRKDGQRRLLLKGWTITSNHFKFKGNQTKFKGTTHQKRNMQMYSKYFKPGIFAANKFWKS